MHKRKNTKDINTVNPNILIGSQSDPNSHRNHLRLGRLVQFQRYYKNSSPPFSKPLQPHPLHFQNTQLTIPPQNPKQQSPRRFGPSLRRAGRADPREHPHLGLHRVDRSTLALLLPLPQVLVDDGHERHFGRAGRDYTRQWLYWPGWIVCGGVGQWGYELFCLDCD
jgi:hypothetical protein